MINVQIKESDWKGFDEIEIDPETPYWFKMTNGNIVLAVHLTTQHSSGWARCQITNEGKLEAKGNEFYMLRGAKLQCALTNEG